MFTMCSQRSGLYPVGTPVLFFLVQYVLGAVETAMATALLLPSVVRLGNGLTHILY